MKEDLRKEMIKKARENGDKHGKTAELDFGAGAEWMYEMVVKNNAVLPHVINWAFFPEDKPNYGDEILIYPPPEQLAKKEVLIYGRHTDLIDGTKWALLTPCL